MDLGLTGKVFMVAAAGAGLGYGVAQALAREGASVAIGARTAAEIESAARRLEEETGSPVLPAVIDVTDPGSLRDWMQNTLERFGGLDGLVTNAGGPLTGLFAEIQEAEWQHAFELSLLSAVRLVRIALPALRLRRGNILMLTGTAAKEPIPGMVLSNVMRAGVAGLAKTLSREFAPDGIRVNTLMAGRIDTRRVQALDAAAAKRADIPTEEQRAITERTIPLSRYGTPEEFGGAAAFLLSDAAAYITGANLAVDGGMLHGIE